MLNQLTLIGRTGKDPEVKHLEGGNAVAKFSIATSYTYKDKSGQKVEETEWTECVVWGKQAEVVEKYVKKGMLLFVQGRKKTRSWEKDGIIRYGVDLVVETIKFLTPANSGTESPEESNDKKKNWWDE